MFTRTCMHTHTRDNRVPETKETFISRFEVIFMVASGYWTSSLNFLLSILNTQLENGWCFWGQLYLLGYCCVNVTPVYASLLSVLL